MVTTAVPVFPVLGLVLFLIAGAIIAYGLTQPRWRPAAVMTLVFGGVALLLLGFIGVSSVEVVRPAQVATIQYGGPESIPYAPPPEFLHRHDVPMPVGLQPDLGVRVMRAPSWMFLIVVCAVVFALVQAGGLRLIGFIAGGAAVLLGLAVAVYWLRSAHVPQEAVLVEYTHPDRQAIEREWVARATPVSTVASGAEEVEPATSSSGDPHRIERFEAMKENGTLIEALPEWVVSPEISDPAVAVVDSEPQANVLTAEGAVLSLAQSRLADRLRTLHPEVGGWFPSMNEVRSSGAIVERVRETQLVRIDVADAVIREPLYREYWKVSLEPKVINRLLAAWRPEATQNRVGMLAAAVAAVSALCGGVAFALRRTASLPV